MSTEKIITVRHNAALYDEKLRRAINGKSQHIEMDLTVANGKLVVAHEPESYLALSPELQALQDPDLVLAKILEAGKYPFWDIKEEAGIEILEPLLKKAPNKPEIMASSHNHQLLDDLHDLGLFGGIVLYSIEYIDTLNAFLAKNSNKHFSNNYGVSIGHKILTTDISKVLKEMGLRIAAWSPFEPDLISKAISNGAQIVTSDNFDELDRIEEQAD